MTVSAPQRIADVIFSTSSSIDEATAELPMLELDAREANTGRSFEIVFLPGLAERIFPQKPREHPILLACSPARSRHCFGDARRALPRSQSGQITYQTPAGKALVSDIGKSTQRPRTIENRYPSRIATK